MYITNILVYKVYLIVNTYNEGTVITMMKKTLLIFALMLTMLCVVSCGKSAGDVKEEDVNPDMITLESALGLNEQIYLNLAKGEYVISYKKADAEEYTVLDKELMLENGEMLDCYILGLAKGLYDVKIEQGEGDSYARKIIYDIDVEKQDRSGYAHFKNEEGIGGYNDDGTVKENAKILYVSNATKNTVTIDINGTTYTGLIEILKANQQMNEPLIIRVLDKITTNQWKTETEAPRADDYSTVAEGYFENLFSDKQGENLAGLPVTIYSSKMKKVYNYVTTADGIELVQEVDEETPYDLGQANIVLIESASNITIEGVGSKAEFYQFGIGFNYSDSIEIKNITFSSYPIDGIEFYAFGKVDQHGRYWIHHNTFKAGKNLWDEDSDYDEAIDMADVRNVTIAYNKFYKIDKTMLLGGWEYDACMNMTFHHNFYMLCGQRLPLSRNSNIHNYNNLYADCTRGLSPRTSTYVFGEANYFDGVSEAYYISGTETWGVIKSFGEIYRGSGTADALIKVTERDATVENTCMPDEKTDYSKFDTDPELFYYDAENKRSDVEILHEAKDVLDFVPKYAGAGILERMDFPTDAE